MLAFYSDQYVLPLPEGHRFPMSKYRLLRERVAAELPQVRECDPVPLGFPRLAECAAEIRRKEIGAVRPARGSRRRHPLQCFLDPAVRRLDVGIDAVHPRRPEQVPIRIDQPPAVADLVKRVG